MRDEASGEDVAGERGADEYVGKVFILVFCFWSSWRRESGRVAKLFMNVL